MLFAPREIPPDHSIEKIQRTIIGQVAGFLFKSSLVVIIFGGVVLLSVRGGANESAAIASILTATDIETETPRATATATEQPTHTPTPSSTPSQIPSATPKPTATERPTKTPRPSSTPTATPDYRATDDANIAAMATQAVKAELREQRIDKLVEGLVVGLYICSGFVGLAIMVAILWIVNERRPEESEAAAVAPEPVEMVAPLVETQTSDRQIVRDRYFKMPDWVWRDIADELLKGDRGRWGYNYWEEQHRGGPRSEKWFAGNSSDPNKNYRQFQTQLLERGVIAQIGGTDQRPVYGSTVYGRHIASEINMGNYNIPIPLQTELAPPK
jgi:hypothetical protein